MLIYSKRNVILPSVDRSQTVLVRRNCIGEIPAWAAETDYFKALVKEGTISVTTTKLAEVTAEKESAADKPKRKIKKAETKADAQPPAKAEAQAAE